MEKVNKHIKLLNYMRNYCEVNSHPLGEALQADDDYDVLRSLFLNFRAGDQNNPKGLRLSHMGLQYAKLCFQHWEIIFDGNWRVSPNHVIFLDRHCQLPYHLFHNHLTLFDKELAVQIKLIGNLDTYMSMAKENHPDLINKRA